MSLLFLLQNPVIQSLVQFEALRDTTERSMQELKRIISTIDTELPLWHKCRMILAIRELQPHEAINIAAERDFAEEDKFDVSVILHCAVEIINILSLKQDVVPLTQQNVAVTPFFFTTSVLPLPDSTFGSGSGSGSSSGSGSGTVSPTSFSITSTSSSSTINSMRAYARPYPRTKFTPKQIEKMETFFETVSSNPSNAQVEAIAAEFERDDSRSVRIWFKNKRAKQARSEKRMNADLPNTNHY